MNKFHRSFNFLRLVTLGMAILASCAPLMAQGQMSTATLAAPQAPTSLPAAAETPSIEPSPTAKPQPRLWINQELPGKFLAQVKIPAGIEKVENVGEANMYLDFARGESDQVPVGSAQWVFVLAAPFKTVANGVTNGELKKAWKGKQPDDFKGLPLIMTSTTRKILEGGLGPAGDGAIKEVDQAELIDLPVFGQPGWAILPFDELDPHWKVLKISGADPLSKKFNPEDYALSVQIALTARPEFKPLLMGDKNGLKQLLPSGNRDPEKMTVLMLTGTTCMVRYLALKMEENGVLYPATDILDTLKDSDILHISNEASFYTDCPPAVPVRREQRFCSDPKYIDLLTYVGTSVVELTGNHLIDWGVDPFEYTLNLYKEKGIPYYGGGFTQNEARKPLLLEDHGNKIALMGCNTAGPKDDWASANQAGSARCDYDYITGQITDLKAKGYLPVFTYQHYELEDYHPTSLQRVDFHHMADLGAVIVSGSQSHYPQFMVFQGDTFIHYGLGNTFFDQMMEGNRKAFIDRHVFYDGKYISTQLVPVILEDYARLRQMTDEERRVFLKDIFDASVGDRIYTAPPPVTGG